MTQKIIDLQNNQSQDAGKIQVMIYSDHSCETIEGRWTGLRRLKEIYELSNKKYWLTNNPEAADIILFGDITEKDWTRKILENELINKYPHKCFSLSWYDLPGYRNHGIFINSEKSILSLGRVRTGLYALRHENEVNPYIESHRISDQDYSGKKYLFSFIGRKSHKVRSDIFNLAFNRQDVFIEDSSFFDLWSKVNHGRLERQKYFYNMLLCSKFSLCPRGWGTNSIRLYESMQLGVAPVIISDAWIFPTGPRWSEFSIVIKEKNIRDLEKITQSHESNYKEMGRLARKVFEEYFSEDVYFNYLINNCLDIKQNQLVPEAIYLKCDSLLRKSRNSISKIRDKLDFRWKR
jgi:hypothetical protein